ncbi:MAG: hypothetical protein QOF66_2008, partial [Mycobacterium sp.]|nr:hypothetical protein [Mycobacterium sp.]
MPEPADSCLTTTERGNRASRDLSVRVDPYTIECMFDLDELAAVDPHADEAAYIEQIAWLERVKSAAAAGQA